MIVYLDNSATTKQHDFVTGKMVAVMENTYGNASALHRMGMAAEKQLKTARHQLSLPLGVRDEEIYITSGGTESNNTVHFGVADAMKRKGNHIITTEIEHPSILECCKKLSNSGFEVTYIGVDAFGRVDVKALEQAITPATILISVMNVNNELGTIEPIDEIGRIKSKHEGILFHTDAVQSYGKLQIKPYDTYIDLLSASGHKLHGPKGSGLLYIKKGTRINPLHYGGGQEKGFRSGTENVPAAAGFGAAAEYAAKNMDRVTKQIEELRDYFLDGIKREFEDIRINSPVGPDCVPSVLNISFIGTRGEVLLHTLEQSEIYVSTGSACSSNKKGRSHVLEAAGLRDKEIEGAVRFSFSEYNTTEQMDYTLDKLKKAVGDIRRTLKYRK